MLIKTVSFKKKMFEITTERIPNDLKVQERIGVPVVCFVSPLREAGKSIKRVKDRVDRCERCFAYPSKYSRIQYPDRWYCSLCGRKNVSRIPWVKRNGKIEFETNAYEIWDTNTIRKSKHVVLALIDADVNESLMDDIKKTLIRTCSSLLSTRKNTCFALCSFDRNGTLHLHDATCEHTPISMECENVNLKDVFTSRDHFFATHPDDAKRAVRTLLSTSSSSSSFSKNNICGDDENKRPVLLALRKCFEVLFCDENEKEIQYNKQVICFLGGEMKRDERNSKILKGLVNRSNFSIDVFALHDISYGEKCKSRFVDPSLVSACRQSGGEFRVYDREDIVSSRFDTELSQIITTSPRISNCMIRLRASPDMLSVGRCFGLVREPTKNREGIWRATRCNQDTSFAFELELIDRSKWWTWTTTTTSQSYITLQFAFMYEICVDGNMSQRVRRVCTKRFPAECSGSHIYRSICPESIVVYVLRRILYDEERLICAEEISGRRELFTLWFKRFLLKYEKHSGEEEEEEEEKQQHKELRRLSRIVFSVLTRSDLFRDVTTSMAFDRRTATFHRVLSDSPSVLLASCIYPDGIDGIDLDMHEKFMKDHIYCC